MNKKQKMIISIIGITIILLAFIGLTYAYFLTRIQGNANDKSVSVSTANLQIVYSDNSAEIIGKDLVLEPSDTEIGTKTFTVTNEGNAKTNYVVVIEDVRITKGGTTSTFESNDFRYTLTCSVKDKSGNDVPAESCNGVESLSIFPIKGGILVGNDISKNRVQEYTLTLWYIDTGLNQSDDMSKSLQARVNIKDVAQMENPFMTGVTATDNASLAYNIINNAKTNKNGTTFVNSPLTKVAEEASMTSGTGEYEQILGVTPDDYGTSYYFRGNVEDNYVNFAGMCWRIVRIAGDGSTKLILEDKNTTCNDIETKTTTAVYTGNWNIGTGNYGYEQKNVNSDSNNQYIMNYLKPVTSNTSSMVKAFYDFQISKLADYTSKLKSGDWCLGDKAYTRSGSSGSYTYTLLEEYNYSLSMYYDSYTRLTSGNAKGYQPTLKCNGTILNEFADVSGVSSEAPMYVSTITADEIVYAGGKWNDSNYNYYLMNDYSRDSYYFWSLSPYIFSGDRDRAFYVFYNGRLNDRNSVSDYCAFRPAISLASNAVITGGEGTLESPYIIG